MSFFPFDWLDGVPANVIANAMAVVIGVAAARLGGKVANRRIWSLGDPSKLVIFVAEDAQEQVRKKSSSYMRPSTGVGQVRALARIAPSLKSAYREADLGKVVMAGEGIRADLAGDLISLGGAKNNRVTREILSKLSQHYVLPPPSTGEGFWWIDPRTGRQRLCEPDPGWKDGSAGAGSEAGDDRIERDYGAVVKAPNPWNPKATVVVLYGASTHGTAAAAAYFVAQDRWRRPEHFAALVEVSVSGGYSGEPTLRDRRSLEERPAMPVAATSA